VDVKRKKLEADGEICLRRAKAHLEKHSRTWDSNKSLMMGRLNSRTRNGIAEAYGIFRSLVSNILAAVPGVYFEAKKEEAKPIAGFLTDAVNYDFTIGNLRDRMAKALWRNFPYGFGGISENVETVHRKDEKGRVIGIESQRFFWKNIPCRDSIFDPDGFNTDLSDHRYIFLAYYKTIREIREEVDNERKKVYFNLDKIEDMPRANEASRGPDSDSGLTAGIFPGTSDDMNPDFHQIKVWRWYDRVNETISDFCDADHRLIRHEPWPLPIKIQGVLQFPINLLAMNTESDDFYPIPECDLLRPQLTNLIRLNDQMMTDLTDKVRKYIALSPFFDPVKLGKFLDLKNPNKFFLTSDIDVMKLKGDIPKVTKAGDAISKLDDVEADPQLPHGMAEIRAQMHNISAYGDPARGGLPQIRSAKEAAHVSDQVNKSLTSRQSPLEAMTANLAMYHLLLLKYTAPDDQQRYFRVTDKLQGVKTWLSYCPKDIPSEEDLFCDVYPGSSTPQNLDGKKAQLLEEMRVMVPILQQERLSMLPLLYRYMEVFNVKYGDTLLKNQKGAAQEFLAATMKAAQMGKDAPPDLLINAGMSFIDSVLNGSEKQAVIQAMQQQQQGPQGAPPGGLEAGNMGQMPSPTMGNQDGAAAT